MTYVLNKEVMANQVITYEKNTMRGKAITFGTGIEMEKRRVINGVKKDGMSYVYKKDDNLGLDLLCCFGY